MNMTYLILFYFLTGRVDSERERETERKVFLCRWFTLQWPPRPMRCGRRTALIQSQEPGASSWSPMGCRAQALGPSSTAFLGHSRELAWKRSNWDRIRRPDQD